MKDLLKQFGIDPTLAVLDLPSDKLVCKRANMFARVREKEENHIEVVRDLMVDLLGEDGGLLVDHPQTALWKLGIGIKKEWADSVLVEAHQMWTGSFYLLSKVSKSLMFVDSLAELEVIHQRLGRLFGYPFRSLPKEINPNDNLWYLKLSPHVESVLVGQGVTSWKDLLWWTPKLLLESGITPHDVQMIKSALFVPAKTLATDPGEHKERWEVSFMGWDAKQDCVITTWSKK